MRSVVMTKDFQFDPPTRRYTEFFRAGLMYTEVTEPAAAAIVAAGAGYIVGDPASTAASANAARDTA